MSTKQIVKVNGQPLAIGVALAFFKLKAAFEIAFPGLTLVVTYGIRSRQEQADLFYGRYVTRENLRGRRYTDTIYWQGKTWYNVSGLGRAAPPGHSNHEIDGPSGGRAIDIRDTGSDPGVTRYGNPRSAWIKKNARSKGFATTGYDYFNEPWHLELIGDPWAGESTAGEQTPKEEAEVKHYHTQDRTARSGGRTVPPGKHFYLHTLDGVATSQASNIVGGIGTYSITMHVYAEGTPGDAVDVVLLWDDTKTAGPHSAHYTERLTIGRDGLIRANFEFKRAVASGYAVYARLVAAESNQADVKVTVFDADAFLFLG